MTDVSFAQGQHTAVLDLHYRWTDTGTDRQTNRQRDGQTDEQTDGQTDRQTNEQTDKGMDRHTDRQRQSSRPALPAALAPVTARFSRKAWVAFSLEAPQASCSAQVCCKSLPLGRKYILPLLSSSRPCTRIGKPNAKWQVIQGNQNKP